MNKTTQKNKVYLSVFAIICVARVLLVPEELVSHEGPFLNADELVVLRLMLELCGGGLAWVIVHGWLAGAQSSRSTYVTTLINGFAAMSASVMIALWTLKWLLHGGLLIGGSFFSPAFAARNAEVGAVVLSDVILASCLSCLAFRFLDAVHAGADRGDIASKALCSLGIGLCSAASSITWLIWNSVLGIQRFGGIAVTASPDGISIVLYMGSALLILVAVAWLCRGGLRRSCLSSYSRPERDIDLLDGPISEQSHSSVRMSAYFGLACTAILSICACLVTLVWTRYGLDLGDEGFYLVNMSDPERTMSMLTFGKVYNPLFELASGNIVVLRCANVLLTFLCGFVFMWAAVRFVICSICKTVRGIILPSLLVSLGLASSVLVYFQYEGWMTPSYNSLALQGLCLSSAGMLTLQSGRRNSTIAGILLIGAGIVLSFLAKPTTGVLAWIVISLYLCVACKIGLRLYVYLSLATALLVVGSLCWTDGSLGNAAARYMLAHEESVLLWSGEGLLGRMDLFRWINLYNRELFGLSLCVVASTVLAGTGSANAFQALSLLLLLVLGVVGCGPVEYGLSLLILALVGHFQSDRPASSSRNGLLSRCLPVTLAVTGLLAWSGVLGRRCGFTHNQPLIMFSIPLGVVLGCFGRIGGRASGMGTPAKASVLVLLAMPFVYYGGSSGGVWQYAGTAGIFWVAAALVVLRQLPRQSFIRAATLVALTSQLLVGGITLAGLQMPFDGVDSVWLDTRGGAKIRVRRDVGEFVSSVRDAAAASGVERGGYMLNLSQNSAVAYLLGATELGTFLPSPALCPGAEAYAHSRLSSEKREDLRRAWVLQRENSDPNHLPSEMLLRYGIDLNSDYKVLGSFIEPIQKGRVSLFAPFSSRVE